MFTKQELRLCHCRYFNVLREDETFIELQSKCTKHQWIICNNYFENHLSLPISLYHKHSKAINYHKQCNCSDVISALRYIKSHDTYFIKHAAEIKWNYKKR